MRVYRLCRAPFSALDGEGARLFGGRWNTPGLPVVYTSTSLALAALEYLVHVDPVDVPADLVAITIDVPDHIPSARVDVASLPSAWAERATCAACQSAGDQWAVAGATALLFVPAAPVPEEFNVLLNPRHADMARVRVTGQRAFTYDPRLL